MFISNSLWYKVRDMMLSLFLSMLLIYIALKSVNPKYWYLIIIGAIFIRIMINSVYGGTYIAQSLPYATYPPKSREEGISFNN